MDVYLCAVETVMDVIGLEILCVEFALVYRTIRDKYLTVPSFFKKLGTLCQCGSVVLNIIGSKELMYGTGKQATTYIQATQYGTRIGVSARFKEVIIYLIFTLV